MPYSSQYGRNISQSGPAPAPASPFQPPESVRARQTPATSGRKCGDSSLSADLQSRLEGRLQARMELPDLAWYWLTWKKRVTSAGRRYCQLVARGRPTLETGYIGLPTPTAVTATGGIALCKWGGARARKQLQLIFGEKTLNGPLNPAYPLWLMGYPPEWNDVAPPAMPSSRK